MKTHATVRYFIIIITLAAVLAAGANSRAQDKPAARGGGEDGYDLVIRNGTLMKGSKGVDAATLSAVVEQLRERYTDANIVCAPGLKDEIIPDVKLRARDLAEMLQALRAASGDKFDWSGPNMAGPVVGAIDPATGLPVGPPPNQNAGLWILRPPEQDSQNARVLEAFNLEPIVKDKMRGMETPTTDEGKREYFAKDTGRMIQDLIVDSLSAYDHINGDEARKRLEFRFHEGANLLVVMGQKADVEVARRVVNALTGGHGNGNSGGGSSSASFQSQLQGLINGAGGTSGGTGGAEPLTTEVFHLENIDPTAASQAVLALMRNPQGRCVYDQRAKSMVVIATKGELVAVRNAIEQMEAAAAANGQPKQPGSAPKKSNSTQ